MDKLENLKKNIKTNLTSKGVESLGQRFYTLGKLFWVFGILGLALLIVICLFTAIIGGDADDVVEALLFGLDGSYFFVSILVAICYLAIVAGIAGIPMFFYGLQLFALGRIAVNTEKSATVAPIPQAQRAPGAPAPRQAPPSGYQLPRL